MGRVRKTEAGRPVGQKAVGQGRVVVGDGTEERLGGEGGRALLGGLGYNQEQVLEMVGLVRLRMGWKLPGVGVGGRQTFGWG